MNSLLLQCVAVCCMMLQCVAVCCVAVCCTCFSVLRCVTVWVEMNDEASRDKRPSTVCCSVLQCVAVCCSVLLCVTVC